MIEIKNKSQQNFAYIITAFSAIFLLLLSFSFTKNPIFLIPNILISISFIILIYRLLTNKQRLREKIYKSEFPDKWRKYLFDKVLFYKGLEGAEKKKFEKDIQIFIAEKRITGVNVEIDYRDKLLVAASAIIPIFRFHGWEYKTLSEVLIYPANFDTNYNSGKNKSVLGMVGEGAMNKMMILSKPALHRGFDIASDKKNVGIHEFVHLIDKEDGTIDGIPDVLMNNKYTIPWLSMIELEIENIIKKDSSIPPYGATNSSEFFAVVSEYFFENPSLLKSKHPQIYELLEKIFRVNTIDIIKKGSSVPKLTRNSPCYCGSGIKYKYCCGKN